MENLQNAINYRFKNLDLLQNALSHSSYSNEKHLPGGSNERLEFLGDSVLSIVVSEYLFLNFPQLPEGELTKLRSSLVCERALFNFADQINLGESIFFGRGEQNTGGKTRPSILADAFEAVLAAIYLDGGLEPVAAVIAKFIIPELKNQDTKSFKDYKTILQEMIQQSPEDRVEYHLINETGPDHNKTFHIEVRLGSNVIGTGKGRSKKQAEQKAAKEALSLMGL